MKTLYEELSRIHDLSPAVREGLDLATRVRANNVYSYVIEDKKDFASVMERLPIVIPPFPLTWIEFDLADAPDKASSGYLIVRDKIGGDPSERYIANPPASVLTDDAVWLVYVQAFSRAGNVEMEPTARFGIFVTRMIVSRHRNFILLRHHRTAYP